MLAHATTGNLTQRCTEKPMKKRTWIIGGAVPLIVVAIGIKWRVDVEQARSSKNLSNLRLQDNYDFAMAKSSTDLEKALAKIDEELAALKSNWLGSSADKDEAKAKWTEYRGRVEASLKKMRGG